MTYETFKQIKNSSFHDVVEVEAAIHRISKEFDPLPHRIKWRVQREYAIYGLAERRCQLILQEYKEALNRAEGNDKKIILDKYERQYEKAKAFTAGVKAVLGYGMGSKWPVPDRDCGAEQADVSD